MFSILLLFCFTSLTYATDFLNQPENSGFYKVQRLGFRGKGTCIAFIEENHTYLPNELTLLENKMNGLFDHSKNFNPQPGFEDYSSWRYRNYNCEALNDIKSPLNEKYRKCGHDIQVMSMSLGYKTENFQGGASPDAHGMQYNFSIIYPSLWEYRLFRVAGTNNHTLKELAEYSNKFVKTEIDTGDLPNDHVVDDSLLDALLAAIKNKNVDVISISQCFTQLIDFSGEKPKISEEVLSSLREALKKNPKPIVFSAGNYKPYLLGSYENEEEEFEYWKNVLTDTSADQYMSTYRYLAGVVLNGLANDPEISKYLLIACNVEHTKDGYKLHKTSNYPQKKSLGEKCGLRCGWSKHKV
jgi:hypothetical protein